MAGGAQPEGLAHAESAVHHQPLPEAQPIATHDQLPEPAVVVGEVEIDGVMVVALPVVQPEEGLARILLGSQSPLHPFSQRILVAQRMIDGRSQVVSLVAFAGIAHGGVEACQYLVPPLLQHVPEARQLVCIPQPYADKGNQQLQRAAVHSFHQLQLVDAHHRSVLINVSLQLLHLKVAEKRESFQVLARGGVQVERMASQGRKLLQLLFPVVATQLGRQLLQLLFQQHRRIVGQWLLSCQRGGPPPCRQQQDDAKRVSHSKIFFRQTSVICISPPHSGLNILHLRQISKE